ncbi:MAG TPA: hypothetical protein VJP02_19310 [Candidatus Sulfotelmatobacter sp.]|nr:hypothetical protein [Candidatus Sulfotelmatobacter sp.]
MIGANARLWKTGIEVANYRGDIYILVIGLTGAVSGWEIDQEMIVAHVTW